MNKFYKTVLSVILMITALGCSKDEPQTIETLITTTVSFNDKAFGAPKGEVMLFDITETDLKSNYLSDVGGMFALIRKDGKHEFPYDTKNLTKYDKEIYSRSVLYSSYMNDEFSHLPKKMLLYVYIEKPTSDHRDMYSFTEINVGEKNFEFNKSLPAIVYIKDPNVIYDTKKEYIKW